MTGPRPRPGILDIAPYVGGESEAVANPTLGRPIRLASNEGALGPSPAAMAAYGALSGTLHRYPDGGATDLRRAIADRFGLDPDRIVCGAGSDELIALLVRAYAGPGEEVLYSRHGFLMYPLSAKGAGATPVAAPERDLTADVDALLERVTDDTRIVFLANPNNPTGTYLPRAELRRLRDRLPEGVLLVIDAAYAEYMTDADLGAGDYTDGADLVEGRDDVVMTRTFSKIFGLGALRLGWAYAPAEVVAVLDRVRGPFNVSAPAQAAGAAAVADRDFVDRNRAHNEQWRAWFADQLRSFQLLVPPSHGNFQLVDFSGHPRGEAEACRLFLKGRGILVRQMGGYGLPDCLRISIGTGEEMRAVVDALADYLDGAGA